MEGRLEGIRGGKAAQREAGAGQWSHIYPGISSMAKEMCFAVTMSRNSNNGFVSEPFPFVTLIFVSVAS